MSRSPLPTWSKIAGVGVPVTGGGSWLISLAGIPKTVAIVIAAALLATASIATAIAVALPKIIESIQDRKADTLKARTEVIRAKSEARSSTRRTKVESKITKLGMKSAAQADLAERMFQVRALSPDRPEDRRLPNDILDRHLPTLGNSITAQGPGTFRRGPVVPEEGYDSDVFVPFHPTEDLSTRSSTS
jgi:hypothetical protein